MAILEFPPVCEADEYGILAIGGDLEVESLLLAYSSGIFPWPLDENYLTWFAPPERTLLFLDEVHVSRSLKKFRRKCSYRFSINTAFEEVVHCCAEMVNRGQQNGTWITGEMKEAYCDLHRAGYAHSIECFDGDELIGGMYGIAIAGMFAGESMFYRRPNASKLAFLYLIEYLQERKVPWIDCQVMTPLSKNFGARDLPRLEFMRLLDQELDRPVKLFHTGIYG
jgi:leucyl/phenylalanyl-tRNA--protein transferase